jgi:hypothetical protein
MTDFQNQSFIQQRTETYDKILSFVEAEGEKLQPKLILDLDSLSVESVRQGAKKEAWGLFAKALRHLKNGAPHEQAGSMTGALSRLSLRSSSFAASMGVKVPQFEQLYFPVEYSSGQEAALFLSRRLVEAAEGDVSKSKQLILGALLGEKFYGAFGVTPDTGVEDKGLQQIFENAQMSLKNVDELQLGLVKRQAYLSFNMFAESYQQVCQEFKAGLDSMSPAARPEPPARKFNF